MTIIAMPASARIRQVRWSLDRPAQVNRSAYSGARRVVANPWHGKWTAQVELAPIVGEANVRAWRSFLASLKGQINTFKLPATEGPQYLGSDATASAGAAQGATSITLSGVRPLPAGMMVTVSLPSGNKQLVVLTADISTAGVITFEPPLREAISIGAVIEAVKPYAHVALADSAFEWSVDPGTQYGIGFNVEEAF